MSDDRGDCEGWTLSTLYTHFTRILLETDKRNVAEFRSQKEAVQIALGAAEKATDKAEAADNKRFDSVNEFRKALSDQSATFITRGDLFGYMGGMVALMTLVVAVLYYISSVKH